MTLKKANEYIVSPDWNRHILVQWESDKNKCIKYYEVSSAASFTPRPGTPLVVAASLPNTVVPPGGATNIVGTIDPNVFLVAEWDPAQLDTASCLYAANDVIPCIDLRLCRGDNLRNISVMSQVIGIGPQTLLGGTLVTAGSCGKWRPLIEAEMLSVGSDTPAASTAKAFQSAGDGSTASLLYTAGSTGKFLKEQAKLAPLYYTASNTDEQYIVAQVI